MSGRFVRASKFRHVHGVQSKEKMTLPNTLESNSPGNIMAVSAQYLALISKSGGGPVYVTDRKSLTRIPITTKPLNTHKCKVHTMEWSPHFSGLLATADDNGIVCLNQITPDLLDSLDEIKTPVAELKGHTKKVVSMRFHPSAASTLATGDNNGVVKIWDCEQQATALEHTPEATQVTHLEWSHDGALLAVATNKKTCHVYDPRNTGAAITLDICETAKSSKAYFIDENKLAALVFSRGKRQLRVYDERKAAAALHTVDIDTGAGQMYGNYDSDLKILFIAFKGSGMIKYYEMLDQPYYLSEFRATTSQKAVAWLPKRDVDVLACEIASCYRLLANAVVEPVSFQVPRKSDLFQEDLYPEAPGPEPTLSHAQYIEGKNAPPSRITMDPSKRTGDQESAPGFTASKSPAELRAELEAANKRIAELEAELAALKAS